MPARILGLRSYVQLPRGRPLKGGPEALRKFDIQLRKIRGRTLKGLIRAQSIIHKDMDRTVPKVPKYTGNMWHTYFAVTSNGGVVAGANPTFVQGKKTKKGDIYRLAEEHVQVIMEQRAIAMAQGKMHGPTVIFGFSAYYTTYVHERYGIKTNWTREGSGPGFFVSAIKRNMRDALDMVRLEAKF